MYLKPYHLTLILVVLISPLASTDAVVRDKRHVFISNVVVDNSNQHNNLLVNQQAQGGCHEKDHACKNKSTMDMPSSQVTQRIEPLDPVSELEYKMSTDIDTNEITMTFKDQTDTVNDKHHCPSGEVAHGCRIMHYERSCRDPADMHLRRVFPEIHPNACKTSCVCAKGLVRDEITKSCMESEQCPLSKETPKPDIVKGKCKDANEQWYKCVSSSCAELRCDQAHSSRAHMPCTLDCAMGCFCRRGYFRHPTSRQCVPLKLCPVTPKPKKQLECNLKDLTSDTNFEIQGKSPILLKEGQSATIFCWRSVYLHQRPVLNDKGGFKVHCSRGKQQDGDGEWSVEMQGIKHTITLGRRQLECKSRPKPKDKVECNLNEMMISYTDFVLSPRAHRMWPVGQSRLLKCDSTIFLFNKPVKTKTLKLHCDADDQRKGRWVIDTGDAKYIITRGIDQLNCKDPNKRRCPKLEQMKTFCAGANPDTMCDGTSINRIPRYKREILPMKPLCRLEAACVCDDGLLRDERTDMCYTPKNCPGPLKCAAGEVLNKCAIYDRHREPKCTKDTVKPRLKRMIRTPCKAGCLCAKGMFRDTSTNQCVQPTKCPAGEKPTSISCNTKELTSGTDFVLQGNAPLLLEETQKAILKCDGTVYLFNKPVSSDQIKIYCHPDKGKGRWIAYVNGDNHLITQGNKQLNCKQPPAPQDSECPLGEKMKETCNLPPADNMCGSHLQPAKLQRSKRMSPLICHMRRGCVCDDGLFRDQNTGKCYTRDQCPSPMKCAAGEILNKCANHARHDEPKCPKDTVKQRLKRMIMMTPCKAGCLCAKGMLRDTSTNQCVQPNKCPAEQTTPILCDTKDLTSGTGFTLQANAPLSSEEEQVQTSILRCDGTVYMFNKPVSPNNEMKVFCAPHNGKGRWIVNVIDNTYMDMPGKEHLNCTKSPAPQSSKCPPGEKMTGACNHAPKDNMCGSRIQQLGLRSKRRSLGDECTIHIGCVCDDGLFRDQNTGKCYTSDQCPSPTRKPTTKQDCKITDLTDKASRFTVDKPQKSYYPGQGQVINCLGLVVLFKVYQRRPQTPPEIPLKVNCDPEGSGQWLLHMNAEQFLIKGGPEQLDCIAKPDKKYSCPIGEEMTPCYKADKPCPKSSQALQPILLHQRSKRMSIPRILLPAPMPKCDMPLQCACKPGLYRDTVTKQCYTLDQCPLSSQEPEPVTAKDCKITDLTDNTEFRVHNPQDSYYPKQGEVLLCKGTVKLYGLAQSTWSYETKVNCDPRGSGMWIVHLNGRENFVKSGGPGKELDCVKYEPTVNDCSSAEDFIRCSAGLIDELCPQTHIIRSKRRSIPSIAPCGHPRCMCKKGLVRDLGTNKCYEPAKCPCPYAKPTDVNTTKCDINETFQDCTNPSKYCEEQDCMDHRGVVGPRCGFGCKTGCFCSPGYLRNRKTGLCYDYDGGDCPDWPHIIIEPNYPVPERCRPGETYTECAHTGNEEMCPGVPPRPQPLFMNLAFAKSCKPGCVCAGGFLRDTKTMRCYEPKKCPSAIAKPDQNADCKTNETLMQCVSSSCAETTCDEHHVTPNMQRACTKDCRTGCFCEKGFYRDTRKHGTCVRPDDCSRVVVRPSDPIGVTPEPPVLIFKSTIKSETQKLPTTNAMKLPPPLPKLDCSVTSLIRGTNIGVRRKVHSLKAGETIDLNCNKLSVVFNYLMDHDFDSTIKMTCDPLGSGKWDMNGKGQYIFSGGVNELYCAEKPICRAEERVACQDCVEKHCPAPAGEAKITRQCSLLAPCTNPVCVCDDKRGYNRHAASRQCVLENHCAVADACPIGQIFDHCANSKRANCDQLDKPTESECEAGCVCHAGLLKHGKSGECVSKEACFV